jgi:hypothetical protein
LPEHPHTPSDVYKYFYTLKWDHHGRLHSIARESSNEVRIRDHSWTCINMKNFDFLNSLPWKAPFCSC